MPTFDVVVNADGSGQLAVVVTGDLDMMTVPIFVGAAQDALEQSPTPRLRLDLGGVNFIDSTGISALVKIRAAAQERGGELELAASSVYVERVLTLVGLSELFS